MVIFTCLNQAAINPSPKTMPSSKHSNTTNTTKIDFYNSVKIRNERYKLIDDI
jgi:hypothetical protein